MMSGKTLSDRNDKSILIFALHELSYALSDRSYICVINTFNKSVDNVQGIDTSLRLWSPPNFVRNKNLCGLRPCSDCSINVMFCQYFRGWDGDFCRKYG